jgi:uncharacterized protein (DUF58 family)
MALLEPSLLARLERLQVVTRRRLAGNLSAEHRSTEHGESLDFAEYRDYHPGDDFRRIDYQALARLDQVFVRLFEAEQDLTVRLLVDTSASMTPSKLHQAVRVAAALGFVGLVHRDVVTLHTFPLHRPARRFTGRHAAHALFGVLEEIDAAGAQGATPFVSAARDLLSRPGPRGLTVVISDLLTPEWEEGLTRLPSRGGDLVMVHVLAADELSPDLIGDLDLVDLETGDSVPVSLSPDAIRQYETLARAWADSIATRCHQLGAGYVRVLDDDDVEKVLLARWRAAGVLR